jgi:thiamine transport system substrate-binding protein
MNRLAILSRLAAAALIAACAGPTQTTPPTLAPQLSPTTHPATAAPPTATASPTTTPVASPTPTQTPSPSEGASVAPGGEVVLLTHDSFAATDSVIQSFETQTGASLKVLKGGDAGLMVNEAILTRNAPLGDALYGVDNTFLSRALDAGIFVPYESPAAASIPAELKLDPEGRVTPIDYGDVCVNYDKSAFEGNTPAPQTLADLAKPVYRSELVVENPATSSTGLAFVLSTIIRFGETGSYTWLDYWRDLRANDVLVSSGWDDAYYNQFSGGSGAGDRPLVVSYATSPAAEVYFASPPPTESPTGNVDDGCFRQIEFAGVLAGAKRPDLAQALVDFMASPEFQADIALNMFVFPARPDVQPPDLFVEFPAKASEPLSMDPAQIAANRDRWISQWTDAVVH